MKDFLGVDELELDALGTRADRFVDECPGAVKVALVRGAQLRNDKAGKSRADRSS